MLQATRRAAVLPLEEVRALQADTTPVARFEGNGMPGGARKS